MKAAHFVSTYHFYELEKSGAKPYTIRDNTFRNSAKVEGATHVTIHKGYTKEKFTKEISNILYWKDNIIIAWRN